MSTIDFAQWRIDRYRAEAAAGHHDPQCEQREQYYLCHCDKRRRLAAGLTEPPYLHVSYPVCGNCWGEVNHDGDSFVCESCNVTWSEPETTGEFCDDHGELTDDDRWGARLAGDPQ